MKITTLTFCFAFALTVLSAQEQYMKSVVRITAQVEGIGEETGAGIIVGKEGSKYYVVTARHVIDGAADIAVQVHGDKVKYKATVLHQDEGMDATVLMFAPEKTFLPAEIIPADPEIIAQKMPVMSIGHPGGTYWAPNFVNVVQQKSLYEDERFFSITPQAVVGGCSGGPVFLESGAWLGIITETGMVQAKCLKAEAVEMWLKTKKTPSDFIYSLMPEMVLIEWKKPRADSFAIHIFYNDTRNDLLSYAELEISEISTFSLGKYEVTLHEFEAFVVTTGYVTSAEHRGSSNAIQKIGYENCVLQTTEKVNWRHDDFGLLRPREEYNRPAVHVSWADADAYCKWLSQRTGKRFRLPTSDEWAYAFFPSKKKALLHTEVFGNVRDTAWYGKIGINMIPTFVDTKYADGFTRLAPVGSFAPNEWGLHDMYGNVSEWCSDSELVDDGFFNEIVQNWYLGPNWLFWYRNDKKIIVESGYVYLFEPGATYGHDYAFTPLFPPDESNCFLGFRIASD